MRILLALNNEFIEEKLKERFGDEIYKYDLSTMEETIEFLGNNNEDFVIVTKDSLEGNMLPKMYIKQLRLVKPNSKIVYIIKKLDDEEKKFLFANEVFNIVEESSLNLTNVIESINNDKQVIYKEEKLDSVNQLTYDKYLNNEKKQQVISKKKIVIYGTSGSGKSLVSSLISKYISDELKMNLALLDMDIENPSIDIYNNVDKIADGLNLIIEDLDRKLSIDDSIEKYMIRDKSNKNLWYMTNNVSIFDMQNKLSYKYYSKIYDSILKKFDFEIIDLPSSPFLDVVPYSLSNCDNIFFVLNPNYSSIRQAIKYLELLSKLWSIPKSRIKLIVNKNQKDSLENRQIENLVVGYDIVLNIPYIKNIDSYINGATSNINVDISMNKVYQAIGINKCDVEDKFMLNIRSFFKKVGV